MIQDATEAFNDTQDIAIYSMAQDFLDVSDAGLEFRAYLVESTLPTVVVALDKLLREVERRGLLDGEHVDANDRPKFDPINWLGMFSDN